jgi:hypothetical protein
VTASLHSSAASLLGVVSVPAAGELRVHSWLVQAILGKSLIWLQHIRAKLARPCGGLHDWHPSSQQQLTIAAAVRLATRHDLLGSVQ